MKNYTLFYSIVTLVLSLNSLGQQNSKSLTNAKWDTNVVMSEPIANNDLRVVAYHVVEKVNMNFGGRISTYTVPDISMINTNSLGPNNIRTITPKYGKVKVAALTGMLSKAAAVTSSIAIAPMEVNSMLSRPKVKYITVNVVDTYERVLNNGYKSVDMLKKVADKYYFEEKLATAVLWYTQLFELTTTLEPIYYLRYAQSLQADGQIDKAKAMMQLYESKITKE